MKPKNNICLLKVGLLGAIMRLRRYGSLLLAQALFMVAIPVNATFSIVAIDPVTGEVGSAGATCINNFDLGPYISYIVPGQGVANYQAYGDPSFFAQTSSLIRDGQSADSVMSVVNASDSFARGRQRLIITRQQNQIETAAFTGSIPLDPVNYGGYAATIEGVNYALGGNLLIGPQVLSAMQAAFESTSGDLARKLMLSLRAAGQIVGADERCLSLGTSSASAYLRVAKPTDALNRPGLNISVNSIVQGIDPVDGVYAQFLTTQPVTPVASIADVTVSEGDRVASLRITLSNATDDQARIGVHTRSLGSATGGSDFYGFTRQVVFPAGQRTQTIQAVILDDSQFEAEETFGLRLYNPVGLRIEDPFAVVTIQDDDLAEPLQISINDAIVSENAGQLAVEVTLSAPATRTVTVQVHTRADSATGGQDYYGFTRTLSFAPGTTRQNVYVTVVDDTVSETPSTEQFKLRLFNPSGAGIARTIATVTINDDD